MSESREMFNKHDGDGNGQIDLVEFRAFIAELGIELEPAEVEAAFDLIDDDETGLIDFDEFDTWWNAR